MARGLALKPTIQVTPAPARPSKLAAESLTAMSP